MNAKEAGECLDALGARGLWAPWKLSNAEREAGTEASTSKAATVKAWIRAVDEAGVSPRDVHAACAAYTGERWPSAADIVGPIQQRQRRATPIGECIRRGREACNLSGLVSVAAHFEDAEGIPQVWVGATWCDCDRGQQGASAQAQPAEKNGPERVRGLTGSEHRARFESTGRLTAYIFGPEAWQKWPVGDPRAKPPSAEVLAKAAELAKLCRPPTWVPPPMDARDRAEAAWGDRDDDRDRW